MNLKKLFIIMFSVMILSFGSIVLASNFTDVNNHWSKEFIDWSEDNNLIYGYDDGEFKPNSNITRGEFVTLVNRLSDDTSIVETISFTDVDESKWYYDEVKKALGFGYIEDGNLFRGDEYITREEASQIFYKFLNGNRMSRVMDFKDESEIRFLDEVIFLTRKGILNGYPDGYFRPKNPITRGEACKVLFFVNENIKNDKLYDEFPKGEELKNIIEKDLVIVTDTFTDKFGNKHEFYENTYLQVPTVEIVSVTFENDYYRVLVNNYQQNYVYDNGYFIMDSGGITPTELRYKFNNKRVTLIEKILPELTNFEDSLKAMSRGNTEIFQKLMNSQNNYANMFSETMTNLDKKANEFELTNYSHTVNWVLADLYSSKVLENQEPKIENTVLIESDIYNLVRFDNNTGIAIVVTK